MSFINAFYWNPKSLEYANEGLANDFEGDFCNVCTKVKPPQQEGYVAVWSVDHWKLVEDNRNKEYYLPEDTWQSSPRRMEKIGPFPEGAFFKKPEKTEEEIRKEMLQLEKSEIELWFAKNDYIGVKIATGRATVEEYKDVIAEMSIKADRLNAINDEFK